MIISGDIYVATNNVAIGSPTSSKLVIRLDHSYCVTELDLVTSFVTKLSYSLCLTVYYFSITLC